MRPNRVDNAVTQSSDGWLPSEWRSESVKPIQRVPFGSLKVVAIIAACAVCDVLALLTVYLVR